MKFSTKLSEKKILWISFVVSTSILIVIQLLVGQFNLQLLDVLSNPEDVQAAIASMSEQQRQLHAWVTATLDVAYPLAYGALFIGSAYAFFPSKGFLLALPGLLCVPVDLMEGIVQVQALTGNGDWVGAKALLTPLKQLLFLLGMLVMLSGWIKWLHARLKSD